MSSPPKQPRRSPDPISRRRFLRSLTAAGVVAAGGGALAGCSDGGGSAADPLAIDRTGAAASSGPDGSLVGGGPGRMLPGAVDDRVLVVVDLQGGNDGLSTLIPAGDPRYYDYRPNVAVAEDEVLGLDDDMALHPSLARLHRRGITTVEGVGPRNGDLSHFAMTERWERGDVTGGNGLRTGFLGRLADAVDDGSPLVGLSMLGPTPHLLTDNAATLALDGPDALWFLEPSDWTDVIAYRDGVATMSAAGDRTSLPVGRELVARAARSYRELSSLALDLAAGSEDRAEDEEADWAHPMMEDGGQLGRGLYFAADMIAADVGVRVVYAADGSYDTHQDHGWQQADNLARLDASIDGFLRRADELGFADRVLVATISEFGRRVPENDGGLDHGSASTLLLAGPVPDRRLGDRPPLDDLDENDNLRVTIDFDRYLAGLAEDWLGIEAASVLPGEPEPLRLL